MRWLLLIILFILNYSILYSQTRVEENRKLLNEAKTPEDKVLALGRVCSDYFLINIDSALFYAHEALSLAKEHKLKKYLGNVYRLLSVSHYYAGYPNLSFTYADSAIIAFEKVNDKENLMRLYDLLGGIHYNLQNYTKANQYWTDYKNYLIRHDSNNNILAHTYYNISLIHFSLKNYVKASEYLFSALKIYENRKNHEGMGNCYNMLGEINRENKLYEESEAFYLKSVKQQKIIGNVSGLAHAYLNLSILYSLWQDHPKSMKYIHLAIHHYERVNSLTDISAVYLTLSGRFIDLEQFDSAHHYINKVIGINLTTNHKIHLLTAYKNRSLIFSLEDKCLLAKEYGLKAFYIADSISGNRYKLSTAENLVRVYEKCGEPDKAFEYQKIVIQINDSLFKSDQIKRIQELQVLYDIEQKDKEYQRLKEQNDFQDTIIKNRNKIVILIAIVLIITILFLVYMYINKNKYKRTVRLLEAKTIELNKQTDILSEANNTKNTLFSIISHDLRDPFNTILGFSQLILEKVSDKDDEELQLFSKELLKSSTNAFNLLENLLNWSRSQNAKLEFKPTDIAFDEVIDDIRYLYKSSLEIKNIRLNANYNDSLVVKADRHQLSVILRNLIGNAIKFSYNNSEILVVAKKDEKYVRMEVHDHGIGIEDDLLPDLFNLSKNKTRKGTQNESGSGLGLLICKEFIENHGGEIFVKSQYNKGSVFSFTIPKNY